GDVNPSGHLPITYPRSVNGLLTYDRKASEDQVQGAARDAWQPQFEFGAGMSYTTFAYSDLSVTPATVGNDGSVRVTVKVTNSGARAGSEVVQIYLTDLVAS